MNRIAALLALGLLAGCDQSDPDKGGKPPVVPGVEAAPGAMRALPTDAWVGRWAGVESLYLEVARDEAKGVGHYRLSMRYGTDAGDSGVFDGQAFGDLIRFSRPVDGMQTLRASDGEATGLKYLAGKQSCLMVKPGEGYCRD
jgi:hypothetical protein